MEGRGKYGSYQRDKAGYRGSRKRTRQTIHSERTLRNPGTSETGNPLGHIAGRKTAGTAATAGTGTSEATGPKAISHRQISHQGSSRRRQRTVERSAVRSRAIGD